MAMREEIIGRAHALAKESFLAGSGPGGQNANKVSTEVQLRVNLYQLGLPPDVFNRLKQAQARRIGSTGDLLITARKHRTQDANRTEARRMLDEILDAAMVAPPTRAKSRVNRLGKTKRLKAKKSRSQIKAGRGKVSRSDW